MNISTRPGRQIPIKSVPNLRDLGGWPTRGGGRVRSGLLFRSVELTQLSDDDLPAFQSLGIRTVFDLRTAAEVQQAPDRTLDDVDSMKLDVLADSPSTAPAQVFRALDNPAEATRLLGGGKALHLFETGYREIVSLPSALRSYATFFNTLADGGRLPALFHCTTGKDRTGWAAAAFLSLMGVAEQDVLRDYMLTNEQLLPALGQLFDKFAAAGGDPETLRPVIGVEPTYLQVAFEQMRQMFGSIERYFTEGLGIDRATQAALRAHFTESSRI